MTPQPVIGEMVSPDAAVDGLIGLGIGIGGGVAVGAPSLANTSVGTSNTEVKNIDTTIGRTLRDIAFIVWTFL
jgi:hypothetical protein